MLSSVRRITRHNITSLRKDALSEISGSLGDLGTLLPLMLAMSANKSISLTSSLVFSGFFNIVTGVLFGVPIPVQPMKAIASEAISHNGSLAYQVAAAGQLVGVAVLLMSISGILRWCAAVVPVPIVKGIQLGAGLSLVIAAGSGLISQLDWVRHPLDNRIWALGAFILLILTQAHSRFPYGLVILLIAIVLAIAQIGLSHLQFPRFRFLFPLPHLPYYLSKHAWSMAVGQLPLTVLNSIIAVTALSQDLLPDLEAPSVTALGISIAAMNLTGTWFRAMPMCHGSGGLAGQYRFGARSGASIIILGAIKLILGVFFGESLQHILDHFPRSLLAVMVIAAGLELAKVGQNLNSGASDLWETALEDDQPRRIRRELPEQERAERWNVMLTTAAGILAFHNTALGFLAGVLCHLAYRLSHAFQHRRHSRFSGVREPLLR